MDKVITLATVASIQADTLNLIEAIAGTTVGISDTYKVGRVMHYLKECQNRIAAVSEGE